MVSPHIFSQSWSTNTQFSPKTKKLCKKSIPQNINFATLCLHYCICPVQLNKQSLLYTKRQGVKLDEIMLVNNIIILRFLPTEAQTIDWWCQLADITKTFHKCSQPCVKIAFSCFLSCFLKFYLGAPALPSQLVLTDFNQAQANFVLPLKLGGHQS